MIDKLIDDLVRLFIDNEKVSLAVSNKLRKRNGLNEISEYGELGNYHWKLASVEVGDDDYIGYMPSNYYYDSIIKLDLNNFQILDVPRDGNCFYRESDKTKSFKNLKRRIYEANNMLASAAEKRGTDGVV